MALTDPATSARTFTPSSTAPGSPTAAVPGRVLRLQMLQGQVAAEAAVVNDQLTGALIGLPARSFAPLTVAVYVVLAVSAALGVHVGPSYVVLPATLVLPGPVRVKPIVAGWTASLNVAVTFVVTLTPVAPGAGILPTTVGGVVS